MPKNVLVSREAAGPGFVIREVVYPAHFRQEPHSHDDSSITLLLSGDLRETSADWHETATPLSLVVKPAGIVHSDVVGSKGARTLQIQFRDSELDPPADYDLGRWRWIHAGNGIASFLLLAELIRNQEVSRRVTESAVRGILREIRPIDGQSQTMPPWLQRVKKELEKGPSASVTELADQVRVHPVSLNRAFRRHQGVSISEYRSRQRLRKAASLLQQSHRSLTRVAHRSGFSDQSHFCREVKQRTGLTPSQLRSVLVQ